MLQDWFKLGLTVLLPTGPAFFYPFDVHSYWLACVGSSDSEVVWWVGAAFSLKIYLYKIQNGIFYLDQHTGKDGEEIRKINGWTAPSDSSCVSGSFNSKTTWREEEKKIFLVNILNKYTFTNVSFIIVCWI